MLYWHLWTLFDGEVLEASYVKQYQSKREYYIVLKLIPICLRFLIIDLYQMTHNVGWAVAGYVAWEPVDESFLFWILAWEDERKLYQSDLTRIKSEHTQLQLSQIHMIFLASQQNRYKLPHKKLEEVWG